MVSRGLSKSQRRKKNSVLTLPEQSYQKCIMGFQICAGNIKSEEETFYIFGGLVKMF